MKKTWILIKDIINKNKLKSECVEFSHNNKSITDKKEICDAFNNFFLNIGSTLDKNIPSSQVNPLSFMKGQYNDSLFLKPVTDDELILIIKNLKSNASPGWDSITVESIKKTHQDILFPLIHLLNLSLSQGVFPIELKLASVVPIFKSDNRSKFSNYRPVSVLPSISKIYERVFYNRLLEFINKYKILYINQFGFKKNHSTYMALIILLDKIVDALEKGEYVIGVFLDFSKAFDTVNHDILLKKLDFYGVRGIANQWIASYLSNRSQYVSYLNNKSDPGKITCGVPQGSILGPLLFLLYINDLAYVSRELYSILFADDTNVFISGNDIKSIADKMNIELDTVVRWLIANRLSLNINKTKYMVFSPSKKILNKDFEIILSGTKLEEVANIKFLGVVLDNKLNWKDHIAYIFQKRCLKA
jgi:hypothetical protein